MSVVHRPFEAMSGDQGHPVTMVVTLADGMVERVRIGTAHRTEGGWTVHLGELEIDGAPVRSPSGFVVAQAPRGQGQGALPAAAFSRQVDLELYAERARRTLADPSKQRWHQQEREVLEAIEAELTRRQPREQDLPDPEDLAPLRSW
jgi:hypothetical protein